MIRLTFDISEETHKKLSVIPHGMRKHTYRAIIETLADQLEATPAETLHAILQRRLEMASLIEGKPNGSEK